MVNHKIFYFYICQDYGKMKEVCVIEDISYHYKLPVLTKEIEFTNLCFVINSILFQVLELIAVEYPEPEEECIEVEFDDVAVSCVHNDDEYCVGCAHIRDSDQSLTADKIYQTRYGDCDQRELSMDQTLCTVEQRIKTTAPGHQYRRPHHPQYAQPRSAPFTAFTS